MQARTVALWLAAALALETAAAGGVAYAYWRGWLSPQPEKKEEEHKPADHVHLSEQAQRNLGLRVAAIHPTSYWRTVTLPGLVVERPAHSEHGLAARTAGVVTKIHAVPGDLVRPGDPLFTLNLV